MTDTWQLVLIDGLFLCLAGGMGLWFRAWLKNEKQALDQRLEALEAQQAHLERISGRLQTVCRVLELMGRQEGKGGEAARNWALPPADEREARYARAWELLGQGALPAEVARQLDMGLAEVELIGRMLRQRRQT
jgi:hypothetical protein